MKASRLTPNLFVHNVESSMKFYETVLGFRRDKTVPEQAPYIFGSVINGPVEIFFNDLKTVAAEYPEFANIKIEGIAQAVEAVKKGGAKINMQLKTQCYGMREFGFVDPEGWMVTVAERVKG